MTAEERAALSSIEVPRDDEVFEIPENKLPYIVCIIDELADLMMVAQADVETDCLFGSVCKGSRHTFNHRHQRPSVNVITGVAKANLPDFISCRFLQRQPNYFDGKGAEALIGKGDMLFIPPEVLLFFEHRAL